MPQTSRRSATALRHWRRFAKRARQTIAKTPKAVRIAGVVALVLVTAVAGNLIYQVIRKPTELLFFVGRSFAKEPAETWQHYGQLFRTYATHSISPELLAALAQIESTGNPVDRTYWRWQFSFNPFKIYRPASSAVGLFQMTDPAYDEVSSFCIRAKTVEKSGCGFGPYIRIIPSHAVELAAIYLDRNLAAVLARAGNVSATEQQRHDLAALIHLCGGGPATAYARRRFRLKPAERCGDHLVSAYLGKVDAMRKRFQRLAAADS
jgi:hypothetical protein